MIGGIVSYIIYFSLFAYLYILVRKMLYYEENKTESFSTLVDLDESMLWVERDFDITIELTSLIDDNFDPNEYVELTLMGGNQEQGFSLVPCEQSNFKDYKRFKPENFMNNSTKCFQVPDDYRIYN